MRSTLLSQALGDTVLPLILALMAAWRGLWSSEVPHPEWERARVSEGDALGGQGIAPTKPGQSALIGSPLPFSITLGSQYPLRDLAGTLHQ